MGQFYHAVDIPEKGLYLCHYIHAVGGYRYNWHEEYEIMLILIGSADVCVEGEIYSMEADDLLIINPGQGHASLSKNEECIAMVLHLHPSFFEGITDLNALNFHCNSVKVKRPAAVYEILRKWLCRIFLTLEDTSSSKRAKLLGNLYFFINDLLLEFPPSQSAVYMTKKDEKQQAQIKKVLTYIEEKHTTKLTLKELADYAGYNESYLSSLFKKMVGINFYKYLNRVRMQQAITELLTTNKPIADIAIDNGFSDVKSFNALFLESFQKRPGEYRRNKQHYLSELSTLSRRFISDEHLKVREYLLQHADQQKNDQNNSINSGKISATIPVSSVTFMFDLDNPLKDSLAELLKMPIHATLDISAEKE